MLYDIVASKGRALTVSRTVTLELETWAMIEEIRLSRGFMDYKEVLKYVIIADNKMLESKRERDNDFSEKVLQSSK